MAKVLVNESSLTGIADAIRGKNGTTDTYKPSEMAAAITAISGGGEPTIEALSVTSNGTYTATDGVDGYSPVTVNVPQDGGPPESAFVFSGNCSYLDYYGKWDWFINQHGNRITTSNIEDTKSMFYASDVENIPFEINCATNSSINMYYMFYDCNVKELPKINNVKPINLHGFASDCSFLKIIPSDYFSNWNFSDISNATSAYTGEAGYMFYRCFRLRSLPTDWLGNMNKKANRSYVYFNNGFSSCESLDELTNMPIPYTATYTSDIFSGFVIYCYRLKNLTFASTTEKQWKSQVLDLSVNTGWSSTQVVFHFDDSKKVTDDTTYQALKNDPDWWTANVAYSRYNHDSAVATINSLPDTSAYLASAGGTNTIKFDGAAGSATDGGAINTLTEEEIAVATAKGWTVTLV